MPSQPLDVVIPPVNVTSRSFLVTWSPPSDLNAPEVTYTLQLTRPSSPPLNVPGVTVLMYEFDGLRPSASYSVVVFAVSDKGSGPASLTVSVTTSEDRKYIRIMVIFQLEEEESVTSFIR